MNLEAGPWDLKPWFAHPVSERPSDAAGAGLSYTLTDARTPIIDYVDLSAREDIHGKSDGPSYFNSDLQPPAQRRTHDVGANRESNPFVQESNFLTFWNIFVQVIQI